MVILPGAAHRRERLGPNNKQGRSAETGGNASSDAPSSTQTQKNTVRPVQMETSQLRTRLRPLAVKTLSPIVAAAALLVIASAFPQEHKPDPKFQI
jgi:hypothetical protein